MGRASRPRPARLAEKLLQIRTALGLSQNGMLKRLEIAEQGYRNYISDFETGVREPPLPTLLKYARWLCTKLTPCTKLEGDVTRCTKLKMVKPCP